MNLEKHECSLLSVASDGSSILPASTTIPIRDKLCIVNVTTDSGAGLDRGCPESESACMWLMNWLSRQRNSIRTQHLREGRYVQSECAPVWLRVLRFDHEKLKRL